MKSRLIKFKELLIAARVKPYYFFTKLAWRIRYQLVPRLLQILKLVIIGAFLATIIILTVKGLGRQLSNEYREIFTVLSATTGTVIAIFFSLVLIPLNQISSRYSPKFLKYLAKDTFFGLVFLYSFVSLTYDLVFLYAGASSYIAQAAIIQFLFLFITLIASWRYIIRLSNPMNSVLQPVHAEIVKTFRRQIPRYRKRYIRSLASMPGEARTTGRELGYFKVDEEITTYIQDSLLPIREIAIKAIKNLELEQAKNAIGVMTSVVLNYLEARKQYYSDDDPLLYFIYTEFNLLTITSNNELKIRLHPFIAECWRNIGVKAAVVNIKGLPRMNNNINSLVHYPMQGLKELCYANLAEMHSNTPGKACEALADIGVTLMVEGYDSQAASVVEELEKISRIAEKNNIGVFAGSADYAIMRVYVAGLAYRNKAAKEGYNHSFETINKSISGLLSTFLQTKRSTFDAMILNPFIGWLLDPIKGINLARATECALFSDELDEYSVSMNMKSVEWNIENLESAINLLAKNQDFYFGGQALENLYQTLLLLLSYLNNDMAEDHVFYYKQEPYKNDELISKAEELFIDGINILIAAAQNGPGSSMPGRDCLDVLVSLYLITLYENKKKKAHTLDSVFKLFHETMKTMLAAHTSDPNNSNSQLVKYFRLTRGLLWSNKYYKLAKDLPVPAFRHNYGGNTIYFESEYPEPLIGRDWHITRPTFQKNGYYYNQVEQAFGIRV